MLSLVLPIIFEQYTPPDWDILHMFVVGEAMFTPKYLSNTLLQACITKIDKSFIFYGTLLEVFSSPIEIKDF